MSLRFPVRPEVKHRLQGDVRLPVWVEQLLVMHLLDMLVVHQTLMVGRRLTVQVHYRNNHRHRHHSMRILTSPQLMAIKRLCSGRHPITRQVCRTPPDLQCYHNLLIRGVKMLVGVKLALRYILSAKYRFFFCVCIQVCMIYRLGT
jgi:hypothetical protein